jgi:hypothetical protein
MLAAVAAAAADGQVNIPYLLEFYCESFFE